jgi:hypothetical protein
LPPGTFSATHRLVGLDRIGQGCELGLLRRAFCATCKRVGARDKQRVHVVSDGCRCLDGWPALAEYIQIRVHSVDLAHVATASNHP